MYLSPRFFWHRLYQMTLTFHSLWLPKFILLTLVDVFIALSLFIYDKPIHLRVICNNTVTVEHEEIPFLSVCLFDYVFFNYLYFCSLMKVQFKVTIRIYLIIKSILWPDMMNNFYWMLRGTKMFCFCFFLFEVLMFI